MITDSSQCDTLNMFFTKWSMILTLQHFMAFRMVFFVDSLFLFLFVVVVDAVAVLIRFCFPQLLFFCIQLICFFSFSEHTFMRSICINNVRKTETSVFLFFFSFFYVHFNTGGTSFQCFSYFFFISFIKFIIVDVTQFEFETK